MNAIKQLRSTIRSEVFEEQDFYLSTRDLSRAAQHSLLGRMLRRGDLRKVSRGLYVFDELWRRRPLSKFLMANKLSAPSYISFESALSHHGLIPESVFVTTSAYLTRASKSFDTPFGHFTFHHVPSKSFLLDIESRATEAGPELIASPLKALFDLIYRRRKHYQDLHELESDLRINADEVLRHVQSYSGFDVEELALSYQKKSCLALLAAIKRSLR